MAIPKLGYGVEAKVNPGERPSEMLARFQRADSQAGRKISEQEAEQLRALHHHWTKNNFASLRMLPQNHVLAGSPALERELSALERIENLPISGGHASSSLVIGVVVSDAIIVGAFIVLGVGAFLLGRASQKGSDPSPDSTSPQATNPPASDPSQPGAQPNPAPFIPEASYPSLGRPFRRTDNPSGAQLMTHFRTLFETSEKLGFTEAEVEMALLLAGSTVRSEYCSVDHSKSLEEAITNAGDKRKNVIELVKSGGWKESPIFTPREKAVLGYAQTLLDNQQTGEQANLQRQKETFRSELNDAQLEHIAHLVATGIAHAMLAAHYNVIPPTPEERQKMQQGQGK